MTTAVIKNKSGIHARPATMIVNHLKDVEETIHLVKNDKRYNAKSMMNIMAMGMVHGDEIEILAEGANAEALEQSLASFIEGIEE